LPVSEEVLKYCGKRGEGLIFKGFRRSMAQQPFKKWVKVSVVKGLSSKASAAQWHNSHSRNGSRQQALRESSRSTVFAIRLLRSLSRWVSMYL